MPQLSFSVFPYFYHISFQNVKSPRHIPGHGTVVGGVALSLLFHAVIVALHTGGGVAGAFGHPSGASRQFRKRRSHYSTETE